MTTHMRVVVTSLFVLSELKPRSPFFSRRPAVSNSRFPAPTTLNPLPFRQLYAAVVALGRAGTALCNLIRTEQLSAQFSGPQLVFLSAACCLFRLFSSFSTDFSLFILFFIFCVCSSEQKKVLHPAMDGYVTELIYSPQKYFLVHFQCIILVLCRTLEIMKVAFTQVKNVFNNNTNLYDLCALSSRKLRIFDSSLHGYFRTGVCLQPSTLQVNFSPTPSRLEFNLYVIVINMSTLLILFCVLCGISNSRFSEYETVCSFWQSCAGRPFKIRHPAPHRTIMMQNM